MGRRRMEEAGMDHLQAEGEDIVEATGVPQEEEEEEGMVHQVAGRQTME